MCGIAGLIGARNAATAEAMIGALSHRGPNDHGVWQSSQSEVVLAQSRLSILDLSARGHQPMLTEDGRHAIVFNGEIYNYAEVRRELEGLGQRFASNTDTEVLLRGFVVWGRDLMPKLRGMFAFAVWDEATQTVFCARDRLGIKPFLYALTSGRLTFASELKAFASCSFVSRAMDSDAVCDYLGLGSVAQPRTILKDVRMLRPGHYAEYSLPKKIWRETSYWDLRQNRREWEKEVAALSFEEAKGRLRHLLEEATRMHLIADVPVGAFLSGGIDSTAVVALMARQVTRRIRTYSIGFGGQHEHLSELKWARRAAEVLGTEHRELVLDGDMVRREASSLFWFMDQPSVDGINTYFISREARREVTVSLSGIGGDELFAGYPQFGRFAQRGWSSGHPWALAAIRGLPRWIPSRISRPLKYACMEPEERLASVRRLHDCAGLHRALVDGVTRSATSGGLAVHYQPWIDRSLDPVKQVSLIELSGYVRDTLLRDADVMSMAHGLEVRPILLDHPLVEFAYALPSAFKLQKGGPAKRVFVEACRDLIPREILERPKMGFDLPLLHWMQNELRGEVMAAIESPLAKQIFRRERLTEVAQAANKRKRPTVADWSVFVLCAVANRHGYQASW